MVWDSTFGKKMETRFSNSFNPIMGGQNIFENKINFDISTITDYLKRVRFIALLPLLLEKVTKRDFKNI